MKRFLSFRVLASIGAAMLGLSITAPSIQSQGPAEADTDVVARSNGFAQEFCGSGPFRQDAVTNSPNSPRIPPDECSFAAGAEEFGGIEGEADGLGPIFNNDGCGTCHFTPALGGSSQVTEKRAGFFDGFRFLDHPGGSLIQDRSLDPAQQEVVTDPRTNVFAFRSSLNVAGDGYVEAISNTTLQNIANAQPASIRGQVVNVAVFEQPGQNRVGRFGWKAQQASMVSFAADAYVNEMGITSPLQPNENTSNGNRVGARDTVPPGHPDDPNFQDNDGVDVELFALFMRSLPAPARDARRAATAAAQAGSTIFDNIGCDNCHVRSIVTVTPGTLVNGGALRVGNALGNKRIRPFSDFLLHDVDTGDGIVQNGGANSRNRLRTPPLWGLRFRGRFMHDGQSITLTDAIRRHGNQADFARDGFNALGQTSKNNLLAFLNSL
jgi:CxxC motif-containing protein (DUF1111 family)